MASLCCEVERCSRRSSQINHQCNLCLNQTLRRRLRSEQRLIELRLREIRRMLAEINREVVLDALALDFAREVAFRAIKKSQSSVS